MAKKRNVKFEEVKNEDGEKDVRAVETAPAVEEGADEAVEMTEADDEAIEKDLEEAGFEDDDDTCEECDALDDEEPAPLTKEEQAKKDQAQAHEHLDVLGKFMAPKKDDELVRDHGLKTVHIGMVREWHDRKAKGKQVQFSDGNVEMLSFLHRDLKSAGKLE